MKNSLCKWFLYKKRYAYKVHDIEVSKINFGDIKKFKHPINFHRIPITYNDKLLIIQAKFIATLFENKDLTKKVCGYSLRMQDLGEDFISKIESITDEIKSKVKELESQIKKLRKRKLDTEKLSILYNKEYRLISKYTNVFCDTIDVLCGEYTICINESVLPVQHAPHTLSLSLFVNLFWMSCSDSLLMASLFL